MNTDTMKDIIRDAHALAQSPAAEDLIRAGAETIARRLERLVSHGLYITPKKALDVVLANPPMNPPAADAEETPRNSISRAETVRILMQLQGIEARDGHPNINAALEMAIAAVLKRHRDTCRNKALRRAARMANSAAKEVA